MKKISILAYPGCMGTELFGLSDTLLVANHVATALSRRRGGIFDVRIEGLDKSVQLAGGARLSPQTPHRHPELLVIPGFELSSLAVLEQRLRGYQPYLRHIVTAHRQSISLASICVGSFLLAEAGVLDGRAATTAWLFAPDFSRRYPSVRLRKEDLLVEDGGVTTTGAFSSALDLGLHLARQHGGEELAHTVGKIVLHETQRHGQTRFIDHALLERPTGAFSDRVKAWLQQHMPCPYRLDELAGAFHVSTRTVNRRFKAETGISPLAYARMIRIEAAKKLLSLTDFNVAEITERVGYEDVSSFIRMFNQQVGCSPSRYRQQLRGS